MVNAKSSVLLPACFFLLSACAGGNEPVTAVSVSSQASAASEASYTLPADPVHGAVTHLAIGPLNGEEAILANGSAVVWMFEDDTARVSVQLNITPAASGTLYMAWLKGESDASFEKLGILANQAGDVRHSLKIEALKDYKRYNSIIVTRESSEGVSVPGKIVANGILKTKAR